GQAQQCKTRKRAAPNRVTVVSRSSHRLERTSAPQKRWGHAVWKSVGHGEVQLDISAYPLPRKRAKKSMLKIFGENLRFLVPRLLTYKTKEVAAR
ncbi:MAG TPA: hypothetical protein VFU02_05945, partial [Polyangiaceae bacterium]|nr:hypothetical protein [Polyangiaceae bacterium]